MGTQDYKTAVDLGVTEVEREALVATIGVLQKEQLVFDMGTGCRLSEKMGVNKRQQHACKTHACIGGTMSLLMQNDMRVPEIVTQAMARNMNRYVSGTRPGLPHDLSSHSPSLYQLFYDGMNVAEPTPEEGVDAIERFLRGDVSDPWHVKDDF